MDVITNNVWPVLPSLVLATVITLLAAVIAGAIAMIFGIPAGFGRLSRVPLIRSISTFYVET
ncbi:MAG: hypothetical protein ACHQ4H_04595, partial [Ktedonobacterales bacterium]